MKKKKKTFRSKLEQSVAQILDQVGAKYEYETHKVAYTIQHLYNPDFVLVNGVMPVSYTHLTLPTIYSV